MDDQQALSALKQFIDQAIGAGLFKSFDMVNLAVQAHVRLKATVEQRDALLKEVQTRQQAKEVTR